MNELVPQVGIRPRRTKPRKATQSHSATEKAHMLQSPTWRAHTRPWDHSTTKETGAKCILSTYWIGSDAGIDPACKLQENGIWLSGLTRAHHLSGRGWMKRQRNVERLTTQSLHFSPVLDALNIRPVLQL